MEIERLLKIESSHFDKIQMIISNNLDLMHNGDACVSVKKWSDLTDEILLWHENEVKRLESEKRPSYPTPHDIWSIARTDNKKDFTDWHNKHFNK